MIATTTTPSPNSGVEWMTNIIKDNYRTLRVGTRMMYRASMNQHTYDREITPYITGDEPWDRIQAGRFAKITVDIDNTLSDGQAIFIMEMPEGGLRW